MATKVTDPALLAQLNGGAAATTGPKKVTDPAVLAQLNGAAPVSDKAAPGSYEDSYVSQGMSGFNEGLAKGLGAPVDIASSVINAGIGGFNALAHTAVPTIDHPFGGSGTFEAALSPTIKAESSDPTKQFLRRTTEELGSAAIPGGGIAAKSAKPIRSLVEQALATTGAGLGGATAEQVAPNNPYAELAGEILGGATVGGVAAGLRKVVTPLGVPASRQAAVDTLKKEGVDLTAGQTTGNKSLQYAESELGGASADAAMTRQSEQFTQAALGKAGINANRATTDVMDAAFTNIGQEFDGLAARNPLPMDKQLSTDLGTAVRDYNAVVAPSARAPVIENTLQDLVDAAKANGNTLTGDAYKALRSRLETAARKTKDTELSGTLRDITGALDDAMERGLASRQSPDLGEWRDVRNRYRNMLVIEKAAAGAGAQTASGLISPAQLRQATISTHGTRNYVRGNGAYSDLAHAAVETMTPLPQSGTAPRTWVRNVTSAIPAALGAVAGSHAGLEGAAIGAAAGAAVPSLVGRALLSRPGRTYLGNRLIRKALIDRRSYGAPGAAAAVNFNDRKQPLQITVGR